MRAVPLQPCRRHGKKRKEEEPDAVIATGKAKESGHKNSSPMRGNASPMHSLEMQSMLDGMEVQLQSSQVCSILVMRCLFCRTDTGVIFDLFLRCPRLFWTALLVCIRTGVITTFRRATCTGWKDSGTGRGWQQKLSGSRTG